MKKRALLTLSLLDEWERRLQRSLEGADDPFPSGAEDVEATELAHRLAEGDYETFVRLSWTLGTLLHQLLQFPTGNLLFYSHVFGLVGTNKWRDLEELKVMPRYGAAYILLHALRRILNQYDQESDVHNAVTQLVLGTVHVLTSLIGHSAFLDAQEVDQYVDPGVN